MNSNVIDFDVTPSPEPVPDPIPEPLPKATDPTKIQAMLRQVLSLAKGLSRISSAEWDDNLVALAEPFVEMPEFSQFLAFVIDQFKDDPAAAVAAVREKFGF